MAHVYSEEAVVRIWRNVKTMKVIPTSHFGHAAITVRGNTVPGGELYVSWWPGGDGAGIRDAFKPMTGVAHKTYGDDKRDEMNLLTALRLEVGYRKREGIPYPPEWDELLAGVGKSPLSTSRPGQSRLGQNTMMDGLELPLWSQSAEVKVNIAGFGAGDHVWGLGLHYLCDWWEKWQATKPQYRLASRTNSCAGAAAQALRAAGAEAFVGAPTAVIYMEPVQILEWAEALSEKIEELNRETIDLLQVFSSERKAGHLPLLDPKDDVNDGLWTLTTWKKRSAVEWTVRSPTIRAIDTAVEKYHSLKWNSDFPGKFAALAAIMKGCIAHHAGKPDSKRAGPVLRLAGQVGNLLARARNAGEFN